MIRKFEIDVSGTLTVTIDDEARSDWKPEQGILDTVNDPERFREGSTLETLLLSLAQTTAIDGRPIGGTDGWADFPEGCVRGYDDWQSWQLDRWREVTS